MTHKNLRPISNLQFVSKITDRAVFDQFYGHMTDNELFPVLQSAHRKGHNTETALVRVLNDILSNMNKQHVSILVLLDLSDGIRHCRPCHTVTPTRDLIWHHGRCSRMVLIVSIWT